MVRILKIALVVVLAIGVSACACRTRKVGPGSENIGMAGQGPLADVNFAFDKYDLDTKAKDILGANAKWLKENADKKAQVEGHCDERGTNEYNMALGAKRAQAAFDYLRTLGIDAGRLSTVSYGEELPLDPAKNEAAWARNRRAHFNVK